MYRVPSRGRAWVAQHGSVIHACTLQSPSYCLCSTPFYSKAWRSDKEILVRERSI
jgi:hypothetical protein